MYVSIYTHIHIYIYILGVLLYADLRGGRDFFYFYSAFDKSAFAFSGVNDTITKKVRIDYSSTRVLDMYTCT